MNISTLLALGFFIHFYHFSRPYRRPCSVPQAGGGWPIIGHMHLFGAQQLLHKTLGAMADKYGSAFTIKIGSHRVLVVSSWEMARECLVTHDRVFSDRPTIAASKLLGYNLAMLGFARYGPFWREMRKITTLRHIRASELGTAMRDLYNSWVSRRSAESGGVLVDMKQWFGELSLFVYLRMVGGKRYFGASAACDEVDARRSQKLMRDFVHLVGVFVLSDAWPSLAWLDFTGYEKAMKRTAKELDILVGEWLEEHKLNRLTCGKDKEEQDFMDVMLDILEEGDISGFDADTINKATCLNLLLAGSDTTMVTLTWALSLLVNNQHVLKKAQEELDLHVGTARNVDESDIKKLNYLQAIIKETLRLYPPSPIIGLRAAMEDCTFSAGHHIPAGTRLIVNAWKIQRDERVWPNPDDFQPERFLTSHKDIDFKGQNLEFIPFGSGRRSCPGLSLGLRVVHITLATLLHGFEVAKPSSEDVDMTESSGLTNLKATPLQFFVTIVSTLLALGFFIHFYHSNRPCSVPQAGGGWPIIGHMHLFGAQQLLHKTLGAMADKYGSAFTIKIGSHRVLVVSSWEMARECLVTHDRVFSDRPTIAASKLLGYNLAMFGFARYGPYWREMRKITTVELFSSHRIDMLKHIRASELGTAVRDLYNSWVSRRSAESGGVLVDMKRWFGELSLNVSLRMVGGKRYFGASAACDEAEARQIQKVMRDFVHLFGAMKRTAKELDILVGEWLEEHKLNRLTGGKVKEEQDFMDVMLDILEEADISGFDADTINKATCLNLLLAGSDTTMVTLTWALSLLVNNQHVLKKAQEELDLHIGTARNVDESDIKNLNYLQAIIKETLRLYPPSPIIGLRAAMEDCNLSAGYHIPAGTRLMVNAWKIQRDERVWPNPDDFQPERFLTSRKDIDFKGQNLEFIPFGSGRRSCPGLSLGLRLVHITLATLLHCFEVAKPSSEDVDMTESSGLTNLKATPLQVLLTPRLNPKFYE
ncbi:hypothetical protein Tsubulata_019991 [Turnera subulata]|uniref:Cytochrome P450 n=1 Tax=Turnera subulata TaxID=218843 RepID=A0A9Q0JEL1_9ROSI|nr:hypothetical protein Tsubulata_019991 [Turnera subulata]